MSISLMARRLKFIRSAHKATPEQLAACVVKAMPEYEYLLLDIDPEPNPQLWQ